MKYTKVWYGNQYVTKFRLGKESFTKKISRIAKFWLVRGSMLSLAGWAFLAGYAVNDIEPIVVHAEVKAEQKIPVILERIAVCESGGKHLKNGQVIVNINENGTYDQGKWQINSIWNKKANELGLNLSDEKGNEAMARWIYENRGTEDWYSSKKCWQK